jgi:hypothetical protein
MLMTGYIIATFVMNPTGYGIFTSAWLMREEPLKAKG